MRGCTSRSAGISSEAGQQNADGRPGPKAEAAVSSRPEGQFTLTALQAAPTALYSVLPAPYRSFAAFSVAVRAPA